MKLIRSLPASTLQSIAHALRGGRLKPPYTAFTVAEWAPQYGRDSLAAELVSLQTCGFTTTTLAITLEALAEDAAARQRAIDQVQLVWTSPDEEGPHVRDTSVVVGQLLSEARQSLWISTYSIFNGHELFLPIEEAWTFRPELEVVLILNVPPSDDAAVEKYAWAFWKYHWPWSRKPAVFYDPRGPEKAPGAPACMQNVFSWMGLRHSSLPPTSRNPHTNGTSSSACCSARTRRWRNRSAQNSRASFRMDF